MFLLNQRTLSLLIVRNFIYVFVESMIFVVMVMYGCYVLLKRKENACDELLFSNFKLKKINKIMYFFYKCYSWISV